MNKLELRKVELEREIQALRQKRARIFMDGFTGQTKRDMELVIDYEIDKLNDELVQVIKDLNEAKAKEQIANVPKIAKLKEQRAKKAQEVNEQIRELDDKLFEHKLQLMKEIFEAQQKRNQLLDELQDMTDELRKMDSRDRGNPTVDKLSLEPTFNIRAGYSHQHASAITVSEYQALMQLSGAGHSDSFKLYLEHGIVERDERKATQKLNELKQQASK